MKMPKELFDLCDTNAKGKYNPKTDCQVNVNIQNDVLKVLVSCSISFA